MMDKYIITSAQAYATPHKNFLDGLERYAEKHNAKIVILPMIGNCAKQDVDGLAKRLYDYEIVDNKRLNRNIQIQQFNIRPYQIDPITGLQRFAQRETSLIFASPKQRMKAIAHSNHKIPKMLATTGACTRPNYATGRDVSAERRRLGGIATRDHVYGALVVEVENNERFYMRNIRADSRGKFVDLGEKYNGNRITQAKLEAMVLGDIHTGYTDPKVEKANLQMIRQLNPERIVLHDLFDGHSIAHHRDGHLITQQIIEGADRGFLSLEQELQDNYDKLKIINKAGNDSDIYVVGANHLEFLDRYLDEGRFIKDPLNAKISFELAAALARGENPVEYGINMMGDVPENVHFLKRDEDLKVKGYQLGSHGDKGASGGRGSIRSKENDFGKSITGHTHSGEIQRETYVVGTSTPSTIFYNRGTPTNWTNTNALLWDTGIVQMINIIKGKWKANGKPN